jgi:hypothetical protein
MGLFKKSDKSPFGRLAIDIGDALGTNTPGQGMTDRVEGSMHVVGCTALDAREMRAPCHITYVIQADGIEAFSGDQVFELWSNQWPTPGDDVPVVFERSDHARIDIQTDKIMTHADSARMHADELAAGLRAGTATPAAAPGDDVFSNIEKLATLHERGALTDEEFAAEKQKLLGQI